MATNDDPEYAGGWDAEEDEDIEVVRTIQRLRVLFAELQAEGLPTLEQYRQSAKYREAERLSAQLVALGAAECQAPNDIVAAALVLDRYAKHAALSEQRLARLEETVARGHELRRMTAAGEQGTAAYRALLKKWLQELRADTEAPPIFSPIPEQNEVLRRLNEESKLILHALESVHAEILQD